jgi:hypothetical protein
VLFRPEDPELSAGGHGRVRDVLGRRHAFDARDRDALSIWDTNEMMVMFKYIFLGFNVFLGMVGSFTLVVGGVGVANIMFVVVQERTREIGLRRSLGARRRDILGQVLLEAVLVVASAPSSGSSSPWAWPGWWGSCPSRSSWACPPSPPTWPCSRPGSSPWWASSPDSSPPAGPRAWTRPKPSAGTPEETAVFRLLLAEFWTDLKAQRTRALLTLFAVFWGTLTIVLLLGFGEGLKRAMVEGTLGAGQRMFMVYGGETTRPFQGLPGGRRIRLVQEDLDLLMRAIPEIDRGSVSYGRWGTVLKSPHLTTTTMMEGVHVDFAEMRSMYHAAGGRFLNRWTWPSGVA